MGKPIRHNIQLLILIIKNKKNLSKTIDLNENKNLNN